MNPVHDSLSVIRDCLEDAIQDPAKLRRAHFALGALQETLSENTPLAAVAEDFCSAIEKESTRRWNFGRSGQRLPDLAILVNVGPRAFRELERYAREFRAALERAPVPDVAEPMCEHMVHGGCSACHDDICGDGT